MVHNKDIIIINSCNHRSDWASWDHLPTRWVTHGSPPFFACLLPFGSWSERLVKGDAEHPHSIFFPAGVPRPLIIGPTDPSVLYSNGWKITSSPAGIGDSVASSSVIGATVSVDLPVGTTNVTYLGVDGTAGGLAVACVDCDFSEPAGGGQFQLVEMQRSPDGQRRLPTILFSFHNLDPAVSHALRVMKVRSRVNGASQLTFGGLIVETDSYAASQASATSRSDSNTSPQTSTSPITTSGTSSAAMSLSAQTDSVSTSSFLPSSLSSSFSQVSKTSVMSQSSTAGLSSTQASGASSGALSASTLPSSFSTVARPLPFITSSTPTSLFGSLTLSATSTSLFGSFSSSPNSATSSGSASTSSKLPSSTSSGTSVSTSSPSTSSVMTSSPAPPPSGSPRSSQSPSDSGSTNATRLSSSTIIVISILSVLGLLSLILGAIVIYITRSRRLNRIQRLPPADAGEAGFNPAPVGVNISQPVLMVSPFDDPPLAADAPSMRRADDGLSFHSSPSDSDAVSPDSFHTLSAFPAPPSFLAPPVPSVPPWVARRIRDD
ncbi:hypothetical protein EW146_g72 [Bondarzewia mesenterica]|uniref:Uncharacterized protein n=1 Tax=Bondarzewia mesenterica TaxID=1095465 RepID=A0A4S4M811_9AGAM|nr:hypothetical protein EW146_g72 [Bondarzewia mesenterica]